LVVREFAWLKVRDEARDPRRAGCLLLVFAARFTTYFNCPF